MKKESKQGLAAVLVAGVLWGTMSPIGKTLSEMDTDMMTVAVSRAVIMAVVVGVYLAVFNRKAFSIRLKPALAVAGISAFTIPGIYAGFFLALNTLTVPLTVVLYFSHPLLATVGAALMSSEPPRRAHFIAAGLTFLGVTVSILPGLARTGIQFGWQGVFWCGIASLSMAVYTLSGRRMTTSRTMSQVTFFLYIQIFGALWLILFKTLSTGWSDIPVLSAAQAWWIMYLGLIGSSVGYSLYYFGLRYIQAPVASVVSSVEIVTAFLLAALALKSPPAPLEVTGGILIMTAISIASRETSRRKGT